MLAILNFLKAHNLPIFQPILMILVSKFMVHRAPSDKTYLSLGLLSPLMFCSRNNVADKTVRCAGLIFACNKVGVHTSTDVW